MSRMFMQDTKLANYEVMMMSVPNFDKDGNGLMFLTLSPKKLASLGKCIFCEDYNNKTGCNHDCCPYMVQRAKMGSVSYETIISDCYKENTPRGLKRRLVNVIKHFKGFMFLNDEHKHNFNSVMKEVHLSYDNPTNDYVATIYLLTAKSELWNQVKDNIYLNDIDFKNMKIKNVSTDSYVFYQAAKTTYTGVIKICDTEIADVGVISRMTLEIMVHGKLVEKYGAEILKVKFEKRA